MQTLGVRRRRRLPSRPARPALQDARPARIGLYKSWIANIDEGWTRWLLEQYGFPLHDAHEPGYPGRQSARSLRRRRPAGAIAERAFSTATAGRARAATARPARAAGVSRRHRRRRCCGAEAVRARRAGRWSRSMTRATWCSIGLAACSRASGTRLRASIRQTFYCPGSVLQDRRRSDQGRPRSACRRLPRPSSRSRGRSRPTTLPSSAGAIRAGGYVADERLAAGCRSPRRPSALRRGAATARAMYCCSASAPQFRAQPHGTFKLLFNALYEGHGSIGP